MLRPRVCVLRTAGTNCDQETAFAFNKVGALSELVHINSLVTKRKALADYQILAIPGGFTYGDDLGAGKILANELRYKLIDDLRQFIRKGKLIIGICNGFQVLVKAGLLPGNRDLRQEASLMLNDSAKFEDRWTYLLTTNDQRPTTKCIWARHLPEVIYLPVAHGEGKFVTRDKKILQRLRRNGQIVFQYCDRKGRLAGYPHNPNGSLDNIAGICDDSGRILGLMPHPERHIFAEQHPRWLKKKEGDGLAIFQNGIEYIRKRF